MLLYEKTLSIDDFMSKEIKSSSTVVECQSLYGLVFSSLQCLYLDMFWSHSWLNTVFLCSFLFLLNNVIYMLCMWVYAFCCVMYSVLIVVCNFNFFPWIRMCFLVHVTSPAGLLSEILSIHSNILYFYALKTLLLLLIILSYISQDLLQFHH